MLSFFFFFVAFGCDGPSELPGRSKQQCKVRYRLADTVAELTFVFIRVIFSWIPFLQILARAHKSCRFDGFCTTYSLQYIWCVPPSPTPSLSPTSSITHVHRYIGSRNETRQTLTTPEKLTYLSVYDSRDAVSGHTVSPSSPSSLTHIHRCIGSHNATRQTLPTHRFSQRNPADAVYLCESDTSNCVWQQIWCFWARSFPVAPLLVHSCTVTDASVLSTQPGRLCLPLRKWRI